MKIKKNIISVLLVLLAVVVSCGSPNEPADFSENGGYKVVTVFPTHGDANDILVTDTLALVAQGEGGLAIISIADFEQPELIKDVVEHARGYSYKLAILDSVVYIAAGSYGVTVVNIAKPQNAFVTAYNIAVKPAKGVCVKNNFLFTAISERGIKIASLSYPPEPDIRGGFATPGYAQDLTIDSSGDTVFVANGEMGLAVFDISNFAGGFGEYPRIGWIDTEGYAENVKLDEQRRIAYVTCGQAGVYAVDYSDIENMRISARYDTKGYAKDLLIDGDKLYVTSENGGVYFFDISEKNRIQKIGRIETDDARGIAATGKYILVTDKEKGLTVIAKP